MPTPTATAFLAAAAILLPVSYTATAILAGLGLLIQVIVQVALAFTSDGVG